jgi:hypothetical protein
MTVWRAVVVVAGLTATAVSGFAAHGSVITGAPAITRPTKAPVRPTVEPARELSTARGEAAGGGAPVG